MFQLFDVFGPLQAPDDAYTAVVPALISAAPQEELLTVYGDGEQSPRFFFVDAAIEVQVDCVVGRISSDNLVNFAFGMQTTLNEMMELLSEMIGYPLDVTYGPERIRDVRHSQVSHALLSDIFPTISHVPLEAALRRSIAWMETAIKAPATLAKVMA